MRSHLRLSALVFAAVILAGGHLRAQSASEEVSRVRLTVDGTTIPLSDDTRAVLTQHADAIVRSCAYDAGDQEAQLWRSALAEPSSIYLAYATPITLTLARREVVVSQATFSLSDTSFIGQPLLHREGRTTGVAKCDGMEMLELMCAPELSTHFPPGYGRSCQTLDQR